MFTLDRKNEHECGAHQRGQRSVGLFIQAWAAQELAMREPPWSPLPDGRWPYYSSATVPCIPRGVPHVFGIEPFWIPCALATYPQGPSL